MNELWYEWHTNYPKAFDKVVQYFGSGRFIMLTNKEEDREDLYRSCVDDYELLEFFDHNNINVFIGQGKDKLFSCIVRIVKYVHEKGAICCVVNTFCEYDERGDALDTGLTSAFAALEEKL